MTKSWWELEVSTDAVPKTSPTTVGMLSKHEPFQGQTEFLLYVPALILSVCILSIQQIMKTAVYVLLNLINFNSHLNFHCTHNTCPSTSHRSGESFFSFLSLFFFFSFFDSFWPIVPLPARLQPSHIITLKALGSRALHAMAINTVSGVRLTVLRA